MTGHGKVDRGQRGQKDRFFHTLPYLRCSLKRLALLWPHGTGTQKTTKWAQKQKGRKEWVHLYRICWTDFSAFDQLCVISENTPWISRQRKDHAKLSCYRACLYCAAVKSNLERIVKPESQSHLSMVSDTAIKTMSTQQHKTLKRTNLFYRSLNLWVLTRWDTLIFGLSTILFTIVNCWKDDLLPTL